MAADKLQRILLAKFRAQLLLMPRHNGSCYFSVCVSTQSPLGDRELLEGLINETSV